MFIDTSLFENKQLVKIIIKINKLVQRNNENKLLGQIKALFDWMKKNSAEMNFALYIISIIAETYPASLPADILTILESPLTHSEMKIRLNASIIYGYALLYAITEAIQQNKSNERIKLDIFLDLLNDSEGEIRQNVLIFLEQFPDETTNQLFPYLDVFKKLLEKELIPQNLTKIKSILLKLQNKLTLNATIQYISHLKQIYEYSQFPKRSDIVLELLEQFIPNLKNRSSQRWSKQKILQNITNRHPIVKCVDIDDLADEEKISAQEVEEFMLSEMHDSTNYYLQYKEKGHRKILEFEKEVLLKELSTGVIDIDKIYEWLNPCGITTKGIIPVFLRDMMDQNLIKGLLGKQKFFSWKYLKTEITKHIQSKGKINLKSDFQHITKNTLNDIVDEISRKPTFMGFYNKTGTIFYTYKSLTQEIENLAASNNTVDTTVYQEKFGQENQLKLEEYCKNRYFTPYHSDHIYLTNLGLIRIQRAIQKCKQIGHCNLDEQSQELQIPTQILYSVVRKTFDRSNGFWNKDKSQFYFGKYVKKKIKIIQNEHNEDKQKRMIQNLADKLQIEPEEISQKVEEKLQKIAVSLKSKDIFEIKPVLEDLQMETAEFLAFIDTFEQEYLVMDGKVIFAPDKIHAAQIRLKNRILSEAKSKKNLIISKMAVQEKCSSNLVLHLIEELFTEKKIQGIWLEPKVRFLTLYGIQRKMFDAKGFIDLYTVIEEIEPSEEQILYFESILKDLINSQDLKGTYDEETHIYQSEEVAGEANLQTERIRFESEINPYLKEFEYGYTMCREILLREQITPADIDEYQGILSEQIQKILTAEAFIRRWINNANNRLHLIYAGNEKKSRSKGKKLSRKEKAIKNLRKSFLEDEIVSQLMNDFKNWKTLIFAIEQKAGEIIFLKKQLKRNPDDKEKQQRLNGILEYIGFSN